MFFRIIFIRGIKLIRHMYRVRWWWKLTSWIGACRRLHLQSRGAKNILNFIYKLWALAYKCVVMETIMSPPNFRLEERPLVVVVNSDMPHHSQRFFFFSEMLKYMFAFWIYLGVYLNRTDRGLLKCVWCLSPWDKVHYHMFYIMMTVSFVLKLN